MILTGLLAGACGWPLRDAVLADAPDSLRPLPGFEDVRAVDGYPSSAFQASFDATTAALAETAPKENGRRQFDMLVLSSGGVNGAFGAGVLTGWTARGDRPDFWTVTGVSVGALMAPFVFAGPQFDDRLETLFRRIQPSDMHKEKGILSSVLWDESLMDNRPLRKSIAEAVDAELLAVIAERHRAGRRLWVGSTNMDLGQFVVWDMGAIATRGTKEALQLFRNVLTASAAIPVIYPPVRFVFGDQDEMHSDGAVIRPLFMPQSVFDGYLSAERAGLSWDDVDATMYVVYNGSLRARPTQVERDTLAIATRTVTMMSYTMASEHVLHLYLLSRAWAADFRFVALPDGLELSVENFTPEDTERLFSLGRGLTESQNSPWASAPPGYLLREDLNRISVSEPQRLNSTDARLQRIEEELQSLRQLLMEQR